MIGTHAFTDASLSHMQLWTQTFPSSFSQVLGTRAVSDAMVKFVHVSHKEEALMRKCHSEGMGVRKISALTGLRVPWRTGNACSCISVAFLTPGC